MLYKLDVRIGSKLHAVSGSVRLPWPLRSWHGYTECNIEDMIVRIGVMAASSMRILSCYINWMFGSGRNCMLSADLSDCLGRYEVGMAIPNEVLKI